MGAREPGMFDPSPPSNRDAAHGAGRALTVAELLLVLEELDRVVGELADSLSEAALPLDEASRCAAHAAIAAARRH